MRDRLVGRAHTEEEKKKKYSAETTLADVESMKEVRKRKKKKCLAVPLSEGKAETQEETGGSKDYTKRNSPLRCIDLIGFHARIFEVPAPRITHNRRSHFALSLSFSPSLSRLSHLFLPHLVTASGVRSCDWHIVLEALLKWDDVRITVPNGNCLFV